VPSTDLSEHYVLHTQCESCCHTFQLLGLLLHTANGFGWESLLLALFTSLLRIKPICQQINKAMVTSLKYSLARSLLHSIHIAGPEAVEAGKLGHDALEAPLL
jgi:hypothetical protein